MDQDERPSPEFTRSDFESIIASLLSQRSRPELLEPLFAREAEWLLNGDQAAWSFAGRRKSRDAILLYLKAFVTEFAIARPERFDTLIDGEQACIRYGMKVQHHGTGRSATMDCLCFIRVEGGLIVEVNEFLDSAKLFRLRDSQD